jgi:hypothetical protein
MSSKEDDNNLIRLAEYQKKGGGIVSEHTVARAFTADHRGKLRYDHNIGKWFCWDDHIWQCLLPMALGALKLGGCYGYWPRPVCASAHVLWTNAAWSMGCLFGHRIIRAA